MEKHEFTVFILIIQLCLVVEVGPVFVKICHKEIYVYTVEFRECTI